MADLKAIAEKEKSEPQIRLLVCRTCKTIEELPDYDGPAEYDTLLEIATQRHQRPEPHIGNLLKFPLKYWARDDVKQSILAQIKEGSSGLDVFGTNFYDTKSIFAEDAMQCFSIHLRPSNGCSDYKSDRKELKPDTAAERKAAGLDAGTRPKIYLCDFCPAKMHYQKKVYGEKGLYK